MNDLAEQYPEKLQELIAFYQSYQTRVGVISPEPPISISMGDLFTTECNWFCQIIVTIVDMLLEIFIVIGNFLN